MEELFGVSMDNIMVFLLAVFLPVIAVVAIMAWRNRVMLKLGLRNIPRRKSQTALIIVGIMMSTLIMAALRQAMTATLQEISAASKQH